MCAETVNVLLCCTEPSAASADVSRSDDDVRTTSASSNDCNTRSHNASEASKKHCARHTTLIQLVIVRTDEEATHQ